jgi:hypothetical protein
VGRALLAHLQRDRPRDLVARGELVDEALAAAVDERRALAADRLRDQEALPPADPGDRGGMELDELEVGEARARLLGQEQPDPDRPRRVRRARPQRGGASRGDDRRPRADRPAVLADDAHHPPVGVRRPQPRGAGALEDRDALLLGDDRAELADDAAARRAAAGLRHPPEGVAALEAEREVAVAVGVEPDAEGLEVGHRPGRLADQDVRGRAAHDAPARGLRVATVQVRRVLDRQRGGEPALRPVGGGLRERGGRDEHDRAPSRAAVSAA